MFPRVLASAPANAALKRWSFAAYVRSVTSKLMATTPCTVVGQVLSQPLRGLAVGLQVLADLSGTGSHTKSASTESEASSTARTHRCSLSIHATRAAMDEDGSRSASAGGSSKLVTGSLRQNPCGAFVKLELRHCQLTTLVFSQPAPAAAAPPHASTAAAATGPDAAGATTAAGRWQRCLQPGRQMLGAWRRWKP
jgi:hypothetical protein